MERRSSRIEWACLIIWVGGATATLGACGSAPLTRKDTSQAVLTAPSPVKLLAWITVELQDTLATALPEGACVTASTNAQEPNMAIADKTMTSEPAPSQSWRYDACGVEGTGISLSGERHLWASQDTPSGAKVRSRFAFARSRADGSRWLATGQTELALPHVVGQIVEQRALTHGSVTPSGTGERGSGHAYAYHLRITEGLDGAAIRRLSGVAQLNFGASEATCQVRLASLILSPGCPWPVYGHVSVATTASDGSLLDAELMFTDVCGLVRDEQGALTTLAMPWEEGA